MVVDGVPEETRRVFRTVWEMKQKPLLQMAADRGCYIDQSQSLNVFLADGSASKLSALHLFAWQRGLKGTYYVHTRPSCEALQFTRSSAEPACESCSA